MAAVTSLVERDAVLISMAIWDTEHAKLETAFGDHVLDVHDGFAHMSVARLHITASQMNILQDVLERCSPRTEIEAHVGDTKQKGKFLFADLHFGQAGIEALEAFKHSLQEEFGEDAVEELEYHVTLRKYDPCENEHRGRCGCQGCKNLKRAFNDTKECKCEPLILSRVEITVPGKSNYQTVTLPAGRQLETRMEIASAYFADYAASKAKYTGRKKLPQRILPVSELVGP